MLGILCGLEAEAVVARKIKGAKVICSAARPDIAQEEAQRLVNQGATQLLSFGLAGGLKSGLSSGTLIIGSSVCAVETCLECDANLIAGLKKKLPQAVAGPVWASGTILERARDKHTLFLQSGCLCADMESQAVARAAINAGIPYAVLRVIADTADMDLPPAALVPLRDDGRVNLRCVLRGLVHNPIQLPGLIRLGVHTGLALKGLKKAVESRLSDGLA
ncbi:MAG: phosphorylase [Alphaproteobacteria bacterium]|nr:phosphorylase [Alphaproteobacteria bacterium]